MSVVYSLFAVYWIYIAIKQFKRLRLLPFYTSIPRKLMYSWYGVTLVGTLIFVGGAIYYSQQITASSLVYIPIIIMLVLGYIAVLILKGINTFGVKYYTRLGHMQEATSWSKQEIIAGREIQRQRSKVRNLIRYAFIYLAIMVTAIIILDQLS